MLHLCLQFVEVELDAKVVVSLISNTTETSGEISTLVEDCR